MLLRGSLKYLNRDKRKEQDIYIKKAELAIRRYKEKKSGTSIW